eukprot:GHUV01039583.1.p1 GENE.GHUV01039583.1~~GHUV01039583.1.p1  ORF type:complete len:160 (-),score=18.07 GHUV01039583.1:591-1070(-)
MRKKFQALQKDIEEQREQLGMQHEQQKELYTTIKGRSLPSLVGRGVSLEADSRMSSCASSECRSRVSLCCRTLDSTAYPGTCDVQRSYSRPLPSSLTQNQMLGPNGTRSSALPCAVAQAPSGFGSLSCFLCFTAGNIWCCLMNDQRFCWVAGVNVSDLE